MTIIENDGVERKYKTMTPNTKYYKVTAKCGHVGKCNYIPINFAVKAENASDASQVTKGFPRVKKHLRDCIIACSEITKKEYKELLKINRKDPYLNCRCSKDQSSIQDLDKRVMKMEKRKTHYKKESTKSMKYKKAIYELGGRRNSLSLCFGEE